MGKSRGRNSYDDDIEWQEKEEKFNRRREQKRSMRNVANAVNIMIKNEDENA